MQKAFNIHTLTYRILFEKVFIFLAGSKLVAKINIPFCKLMAVYRVT